MKKLQVLIQVLRLSWIERTRLPAHVHPIPTINPEEFSKLLCSGRKTDLRTLAKKLSERPGSRAKVDEGKVERN